MKFHLSVLLFLLFSKNNIAQPTNLVLNPGFEETTRLNSFKPCEYNKSGPRFTRSLAHWKTFLGLTPDLIFWEKGCRYPKPHGGDKMAGIITYHPYMDARGKMDFHEFIAGELKEPLKKGQTYTVEFFVQQDDSVAIHHLLGVYGRKAEILPTAAGNIGVYFSVDEFYEEENMLQTVYYEAISPQINHPEPAITKPGEWKKLSQTFTADQPYRYFAIGNFKKDDLTQTTLKNKEEIDGFNLGKHSFWEKKKRVAYYCIDDVRVAPFDGKTSYAPEIKLDNLKENKAYIFKNVTFRSGKAILTENSFPELISLIGYLNKNPNIKIEIGGHTDNVGSEESNRILSENRARAVYGYLINNGIAEERLSFKGYGESMPIAPNNTNEGRAKNRRVECKLL